MGSRYCGDCRSFFPLCLSGFSSCIAVNRGGRNVRSMNWKVKKKRWHWLEGGDTYAWKLENDCFLFEKDFWISQELKFRPISFEELLLLMHPDHWEEVKGYWKDISKAGKIISRCAVISMVEGISGGSSVIRPFCFSEEGIKLPAYC